MKLEGSPAPGCPRCGDQTLWHVNRNRHNPAKLHAWCTLCGHTWDIYEQNVYRCDDPEGDWIKDQEAEARAEHWAEARAVEDHQERKHREREAT